MLPHLAPERNMPFDISIQPVKVLIDGQDSEGRLIFADGQLCAVIVQLDGESHLTEHKSFWNLEAGFGKCNVRSAPLFKSPEEAGSWVQEALMGKAIQRE